MTSGSSQSSYNGQGKRKFNLNTPSFQPSGMSNLTNKFSSMSPNMKEIPVFVPSGGSIEPSVTIKPSENATKKADGESTNVSNSSSRTSMTAPKKFNVATPGFTPSSSYNPPVSTTAASPQDGTLNLHNNQTNPYLPGSGGQSNIMSGSTDMFYTHSSPSYPLQYHLYAPPPPPRLTIPLAPFETNTNAMFIPNDLRVALQQKNEATLQTLPRSNLPERVGSYHSLVPIDKLYEPASRLWGIPSAVFKVFSNVDGNPYVIRRLNHGFLVSNEAPFKTIKKWKNVKSANVVQLQEAFTSSAFGKSNLIVTYDYYPNSNTLSDHHKKSLSSKTFPITEDILWSYVCQITNALAAIHEKGLAARSSLDITKIVVTNKNRLRLSAVGISDILHFEEDEEDIREVGLSSHSKNLQKEDFKAFGKLILQLTTLTLPYNVRNSSSKEILKLLKTSSSVSFSEGFIEAMNTLNFDPDLDLGSFSAKYLGLRSLKVMDALEDSTDFMEAQLSTELENARLFRLVAKINFVVDRSEYPIHDNSNRRIVKLFRDFIFSDYNELGKPLLDLSRLLVNLNKLDAGVEEKILLVTRDEQSCIIVSYKEIRDIIDTLFRSLTND